MLNKSFKKVAVIFLVLSFFSGGVFPSFAQEGPTGTLLLEPEYPGPGEKVTIRLESYSFDVDSAKISWFINKKEVTNGYGKKSLTVTVGDTGTSMTIGVYAVTNDNQIYRDSLTVSPQKSLVLSEASEGYTPPFYEGRSLPAEGSLVKVVAYATFGENSRSDSQSDNIYSWFVEDVKQGLYSGYGKRIMYFRQDELNTKSTVKLRVASRDGSKNSENTIDVTPYQVVPLFYREDPLLGTDLSKSVEAPTFIGRETSFRIVPYYLTYSKNSSSLSFDWTKDGFPVIAEEDTLLTLTPQKGAEGVSTIAVSLQNNDQTLQSVNAQLSVSYGIDKSIDLEAVNTPDTQGE